MAGLVVHVDDLLVALLIELAQLAPRLGVNGLVEIRVNAVPGHGRAARQARAVVRRPSALRRAVAAVEVRQRLAETL